ncbi:hypothetical protein EV589_2570 [Mycobacterium sp. BK558]|nr:hypothetical protein EV589_2570 [Mycobacterium sp. BK558]
MSTFPSPVSAAQAVRRSGASISVADGESVAVGFLSESYREVYRIARVEGFEDLQTLGLIPANLSERDTLEALRADEAVFREQSTHARSTADDCCSDCASGSRVKRRWYQSNMAQLLSNSSERTFAFDHPEVLRIQHTVNRMLDSRGVMLVGIAYPDDVDVGVGALLLMAPTVHVLNADVITIKADGVLRFESRHVRVTCSELNGPKNAPVIIPDLDIPRYVLPDELTVGGLLTELSSSAVSDTDVLAAHKHLPGFDAEYLLAQAGSHA